MEQEVSLIQMLDARERRVWHQQELLGAYGKPLARSRIRLSSAGALPGGGNCWNGSFCAAASNR